MIRRLSGSTILVAALVLATAAPAAADWLVTLDGARVETKGPWTIEGRRVLFTLPNGTLSAMRASEIDFEASEEATAAALAPSMADGDDSGTAESQPRPEPVLVLTNADIPSAEPIDPDAPAQPEVLPSIADREPVQVVNWKRYDVEDGVELRGTVRNTGASVAANIRIRASVKDEEGEEIASGNAFLGSNSLVSGRTSTFRVVLPEVIDFVGDPTFDVTSSVLTLGGASRPRAADADDDDSQSDPDSASADLDRDADVDRDDPDGESETSAADDIKP